MERKRVVNTLMSRGNLTVQRHSTPLWCCFFYVHTHTLIMSVSLQSELSCYCTYSTERRLHWLLHVLLWGSPTICSYMYHYAEVFFWFLLYHIYLSYLFYCILSFNQSKKKEQIQWEKRAKADKINASGVCVEVVGAAMIHGYISLIERWKIRGEKHDRCDPILRHTHTHTHRRHEDIVRASKTW